MILCSSMKEAERAVSLKFRRRESVCESQVDSDVKSGDGETIAVKGKGKEEEIRYSTGVCISLTRKDRLEVHCVEMKGGPWAPLYLLWSDEGMDGVFSPDSGGGILPPRASECDCIWRQRSYRCG